MGKYANLYKTLIYVGEWVTLKRYIDLDTFVYILIEEQTLNLINNVY